MCIFTSLFNEFKHNKKHLQFHKYYWRTQEYRRIFLNAVILLFWEPKNYFVGNTFCKNDPKINPKSPTISVPDGPMAHKSLRPDQTLVRIKSNTVEWMLTCMRNQISTILIWQGLKWHWRMQYIKWLYLLVTFTFESYFLTISHTSFNMDLRTYMLIQHTFN